MDDDGHGTSAAARRSGEPIRRARRPVDESRSLRCHCASSDAGVATWEYARPGVALADKQQIARAKLRRVAAARSPAGLRLPCARRRRRSASIPHPAHTPGASSAPSMPLRSSGRRLAPFSTSKRLTTSHLALPPPWPPVPAHLRAPVRSTASCPRLPAAFCPLPAHLLPLSWHCSHVASAVARQGRRQRRRPERPTTTVGGGAAGGQSRWKRDQTRPKHADFGTSDAGNRRSGSEVPLEAPRMGLWVLWGLNCRFALSFGVPNQNPTRMGPAEL